MLDTTQTPADLFHTCKPAQETNPTHYGTLAQTHKSSSHSKFPPLPSHPQWSRRLQSPVPPRHSKPHALAAPQWRSEGPAGPATAGGPRGWRGPPGRSSLRNPLARGPNKLLAGGPKIVATPLPHPGPNHSFTLFHPDTYPHRSPTHFSSHHRPQAHLERPSSSLLQLIMEPSYLVLETQRKSVGIYPTWPIFQI